jgi:hypothetical protein
MFETFELSRFGGRPVRLFRFELQGLVWRYCNAPQDLTIDGVTYLAAQIDRSEIRQTIERAKDKLKITMAYLRDPHAPTYPATQALGDNWHPYTPSDTMRVICLTTHIGDTDPPLVEWMGIVSQPEFTDVELTLTCEPGTAIAQALQQGPKWQRGCWKTVYSTGPRGCGLSDAPIPVNNVVESVSGNDVTVVGFGEATYPFVGNDVTWTTLEEVAGEGPVPHTAMILAQDGFTFTFSDVTGLEAGVSIVLHEGIATRGILTAVSGVRITAPVFAQAYLPLAGGWAQWTRADGVIERRSITEHNGDTITLLYGAADLAVGLIVTAKPGCEQTWDACETRFGADAPNHYGGAIYKPVKNPAGDSMSWG